MNAIEASVGIPEDVRLAWNAISAGYDEFVTPSHLWLGEQGLRRAGLRAGMRFLDVAAGSGALSIPAARLGASVLATDVSERMLEKLAVRARREGLQLETRAMDGHALALEDATFDVSGSQFGVMLFPDAARGIRELARVTRSGGRVLMNVYGDPGQIGFLQAFVAALREVRPTFPGLPSDPPALPLQFHDPERLRRELTAAHLKDVRVETVSEELRFRTGKELWNWLVNSNPIVQSVLAQLELTDDELAEVPRSLEKVVLQRSDEDGVAVLTNPVHIGIGTR